MESEKLTLWSDVCVLLQRSYSIIVSRNNSDGKLQSPVRAGKRGGLLVSSDVFVLFHGSWAPWVHGSWFHGSHEAIGDSEERIVSSDMCGLFHRK